MTQVTIAPPRLQPALETPAYDRWITPEGDTKAEFRRQGRLYHVRFPDEGDFEVDLEAQAVRGFPAPGMDTEQFRSLCHNNILPMIGNHRGGIFLHGSAVAVDGRAIAFCGLSRSGKTTLAGAFAKNGYPFMTEDVIELASVDGALYTLIPKSAGLRLFGDSAEYLLGDSGLPPSDDKQMVDTRNILPFCDHPLPLAHLFVLGGDGGAPLAVSGLSPSLALTQILPHSFVLDVEDRAFLRGHFARLAALAEKVPCSSLDYPRRFSELPRVIQSIIAHFQDEKRQPDEA